MNEKILAFKPKNNERLFEIKNKSATKAEMVIYADIGKDYWGEGFRVGSKEVKQILDSLDSTVNEITVRLNSPGGDVFEGVAIYNLLKSHKAKIIVKVDGLAASIASVIAMAGDEIHMGTGALMMIHKPSTIAWGNANDFEKTINTLDTVEEQILSIYVKRTGMKREELRNLVNEETWFDADQAIEKKFADSKMEEDEQVQMTASMLDHAVWINKKPKLKTNSDLAQERLVNLKNKIQNVLTEKK